MGSGARGWQADRAKSDSSTGGQRGDAGGPNNRYGLLASGGSPDRDSGRSRSDVSPVKILEKRSEKPKLTVEKLEREAKATLEEFYGLNDLEEACACIKDLEMKDASLEAHFVNFCLTETVESKPRNQEMMMDLLLKLYDEHVLHPPSWDSGLTEFLELYEDLCVDIPRLPQIMGEWMGRVIRADVCSLAHVPPQLTHLKDCGRSNALIAALLKFILSKDGEEAVSSRVEHDHFELCSCLQEGEADLTSFLERYNDLRFLFPMVGLDKQLKELASNPDTTSAALIEWVESHVSESARKGKEFVSLLCFTLLNLIVAKTIAESNLKEEPERSFVLAEHKMLQRWGPAFKHFCPTDPLQLLFLLQVQRVAHAAGFPKGMMQRMFHLAYNDEIITEDSVKLWEHDDSDEIPGKGDSLFQLRPWLKWLEEADSESEGEDESDGEDVAESK